MKDKTIYAHKVVVAEASDKLITMINHTSNEDSNIDIIYLNDENYETMNEIIEFLYTGSCASLPQLNLKNSERVHDERELTDEDILDALAMSLQDVDFDFLDLPGEYIQCTVDRVDSCVVVHYVYLHKNKIYPM